MIASTDPAMADPIALVEFEQGAREFAMREAIAEWCLTMKMNRYLMVRAMNAELRPHSLIVVDICNWKPRQ